MPDDLNLLGLKGAAELADCDRTTILRAIQKGDLKAKLVPTPFNHEWWGITLPDLKKWMTERKRGKHEVFYDKFGRFGPNNEEVFLQLIVSGEDRKVVRVYAISPDMSSGKDVTHQQGYSSFVGKSEEDLIHEGFICR